jgi:hypothetical protein
MADDRKRGHGIGEGEGVEIGRRVRLPRGAEPPINVYINGVQQALGEDYVLDADGVLFNEPIVKEGKLGRLRWLSMYIGLFGSYRKNETVDVEYSWQGQRRLASDLEVTRD